MLVCIITFSFQYPLNLHCSQTIPLAQNFRRCFNTLWIYTALKPWNIYIRADTVSIPSEFTLLSNLANTINPDAEVSIPSEFTLLSNYLCGYSTRGNVSIPSEFTLLSNYRIVLLDNGSVSIPSEFTLLSNISGGNNVALRFQYPLNLHCSQTGFCTMGC